MTVWHGGGRGGGIRGYTFLPKQQNQLPQMYGKYRPSPEELAAASQSTSASIHQDDSQRSGAQPKSSRSRVSQHDFSRGGTELQGQHVEQVVGSSVWAESANTAPLRDSSVLGKTSTHEFHDKYQAGPPEKRFHFSPMASDATLQHLLTPIPQYPKANDPELKWNVAEQRRFPTPENNLRLSSNMESDSRYKVQSSSHGSTADKQDSSTGMNPESTMRKVGSQIRKTDLNSARMDRPIESQPALSQGHETYAPEQAIPNKNISHAVTNSDSASHTPNKQTMSTESNALPAKDVVDLPASQVIRNSEPEDAHTQHSGTHRLLHARVNLAVLFQEHLNKAIVPLLPAVSGTLFRSTSKLCRHTPRYSFNVRTSPKLEANFQLAASCGNGQTCRYTPTLGDLRDAQVLVSERARNQYYISAPKNEASRKRQLWGPVRKSLLLNVPDSAVLTLQRSCDEGNTAVSRTVSVGELRLLLNEKSNLYDSLSVRQGMAGRNSYGKGDLFSWRIVPEMMLAGPPGRS